MKKLLLLLLFAVTLAQPALACSCAPSAFSPEASKRNIEQSVYIFTGRVTETEPVNPGDHPAPSQNPNYAKMTIAVDSLYKGPAGTKTVTAYAMTATTCGVAPENIKNLSFFMVREYAGDYVVTLACGDYLTDEDRKAVLGGAYADPAAAQP